jgi:hypothetical protein
VRTGAEWLVTGSNGENAVNASGRTQAEAWHRAYQQAEAQGWSCRLNTGVRARVPGAVGQPTRQTRLSHGEADGVEWPSAGDSQRTGCRTGERATGPRAEGT